MELKRMFRTWLRKKLYRRNETAEYNEALFCWVYRAPLSQWKNRIWALSHSAFMDPSMLNGKTGEMLKGMPRQLLKVALAGKTLAYLNASPKGM